MGVLPQVGGGADDDIDTINTGLDGDSCIVHVATDVSENLGVLFFRVAVSSESSAMLARRNSAD